MGCGAWFVPSAPDKLVGMALEQATQDPRFAASAREYRKRYVAFSPDEQRRRIVKRIEEILAKGDSLPPKDAAPILTRTSSEGDTR